MGSLIATPEGMEREVLLKIPVYNCHKRIRADIIGIIRNEIYITED